MLNLRQRPAAATSAGHRQAFDVAFAQPRRLRPAGPVRLTCLAGTAWITLDGQLADLVLSTGDTVCIGPREDVLIVGLPVCSVQVDPVRAEVCDRVVGAIS